MKKMLKLVDMDKKLILLVLLVQLLSLNSLSLGQSSSKPNANITVMGLVYCDVCSNNSFSEHSYFLPGVEVRIICRFNAASSRTRESITFSANRTTNELGLYKLDITSVEGVACASDKDSLIASCQASLISSSSYSCNVPSYKTTTDQVVFKSKRSNLCVYGFTALNFRPFKKDIDLCANPHILNQSCPNRSNIPKEYPIRLVMTYMGEKDITYSCPFCKGVGTDIKTLRN